jgi:hypothetical protein
VNPAPGCRPSPSCPSRSGWTHIVRLPLQRRSFPKTSGGYTLIVFLGPLLQYCEVAFRYKPGLDLRLTPNDFAADLRRSLSLDPILQPPSPREVLQPGSLQGLWRRRQLLTRGWLGGNGLSWRRPFHGKRSAIVALIAASGRASKLLWASFGSLSSRTRSLHRRNSCRSRNGCEAREPDPVRSESSPA